jgi:hypothetical protein
MPPTGQPRPRQDAKHVWRERVRVASEAFEKARKRAAEQFERCAGSAGASAADFQLLKQAQKAETEALTKYMEVLKTFHDLIVNREPPTG